MKKPLPLLLLLPAFFLASCQPVEDPDVISILIAGETTVEVGSRAKLNITIENDTGRKGYTLSSSDTSIATVEQTGYVNGISEGSVVITAVSNADSEITATWSIDVVESSLPSISIVSLSDTAVVNAGDMKFTAEIHNPTSYSPIITWSNQRGKGSFIGSGSEEIYFRSYTPGNEIITLTVNLGPYTLTATKNLFISSNYDDASMGWVAISTAEEFISTFLVGEATSEVSGNYYLSNDIDLGGAKVTTANRVTLGGTLDGRGHKLSNFQLVGEDGDRYHANAGLFSGISQSAAVRNIEIDAEMGEEASGWGSSIVASGCNGTIENVLIRANHTFDNGSKASAEDGYFVPMNSALVGVPADGSKYIDVVVDVTMNDGAYTMYADCAYPTGFTGAQTFKFDGLYTNHNLIGGQAWEWGSTVNDYTGYSYNMDWESSTEGDFSTLSSSVWDIQDGQIPTLKII